MRKREIARDHRAGEFHAAARRFRKQRSRLSGNPSVAPASPSLRAGFRDTAGQVKDLRGLFVCNGILYNHESPRRGENFVTRKIARAVARIARGLDHELLLGNLESRRDWGHARDYVTAMWLMLQRDKPDDYVVASGETHSVRDFVEAAFAVVDLPWQKYVKHNPLRPACDQPTGRSRPKIKKSWFGSRKARRHLWRVVTELTR